MNLKCRNTKGILLSWLKYAPILKIRIFLWFHSSAYTFTGTFSLFFSLVNRTRTHTHTHTHTSSIHSESFSHPPLSTKTPNQPVMLFGDIKHSASPRLSWQRVLSGQDSSFDDQNAGTACSFLMCEIGREGFQNLDKGHIIEKQHPCVLHQNHMMSDRNKSLMKARVRQMDG